jgi:hypothetical protein
LLSKYPDYTHNQTVLSVNDGAEVICYLDCAGLYSSIWMLTSKPSPSSPPVTFMIHAIKTNPSSSIFGANSSASSREKIGICLGDNVESA